MSVCECVCVCVCVSNCACKCLHVFSSADLSPGLYESRVTFYLTRFDASSRMLRLLRALSLPCRSLTLIYHCFSLQQFVAGEENKVLRARGGGCCFVLLEEEGKENNHNNNNNNNSKQRKGRPLAKKSKRFWLPKIRSAIGEFWFGPKFKSRREIQKPSKPHTANTSKANTAKKQASDRTKGR